MALTENEILDRHVQSLKEALDHARWLGGQQDECLAAPRGGHYVRLRRALSELEGSARQMAHFRADARWIRLGTVYAKTMQVAQRKYIGQHWKSFQMMCQIFENGLRTCDELAHRKTEKLGAILPSRPSDWIIMPDWAPYGGALAPGTVH